MSCRRPPRLAELVARAASLGAAALVDLLVEKIHLRVQGVEARGEELAPRHVSLGTSEAGPTHDQVTDVPGDQEEEDQEEHRGVEGGRLLVLGVLLRLAHRGAPVNARPLWPNVRRIL